MAWYHSNAVLSITCGKISVFHYFLWILFAVLFRTIFSHSSSLLEMESTEEKKNETIRLFRWSCISHNCVQKFIFMVYAKLRTMHQMLPSQWTVNVIKKIVLKPYCFMTTLVRFAILAKPSVFYHIFEHEILHSICLFYYRRTIYTWLQITR